MPTEQVEIKPLFINTDASFQSLKKEEAPYIRDFGWDIAKNKQLPTGTGNTSEDGQNELILTPTQSNVQLPNIVLPSGYNRNIGTFESVMTGELYYFNYNSNKKHGIYVIESNQLTWTKIVEDPELEFSDEQDAFIKDHRVRIRVVYDSDGNIVEKILLITDGNGWQKWINTIAAIKTNGFDSSLYPYWSLLPPHFDRREFFEWAMRKPMYNPTFKLLPNDSSVADQNNYLLNKAFRFSYKFNFTDGRTTDFSPYSLPLIIQEVDYISDYNAYNKRAQLSLYAGSALVESIDIFVQFINGDLSTQNTSSWSDWQKVERIYKYGLNPKVLSTPYWTRTNQWANYQYDPTFNTIQYIFDNSRLTDLYDAADALRLQNDIPITSVALTDVGDAILLANNKYYYDNLSSDVLSKLSASIKEKNVDICPEKTYNLSLYAYMGLMSEGFQWTSQVGYYLGQDTQMRFGALYGNGSKARVDATESKYFGLDFADKQSHVCYLKGTPYYAIGSYYHVDSNNNLTPITTLLDAQSDDTLTYIKSVWDSGGYFVCKFDFIDIPAGKYIATLGRHNVDITADYRNQSTYVMGIANSLLKTNVGGDTGQQVSITPTALVTKSKEIEVDLTNGNVDVWGRGNSGDLFYIFVPFYEAVSSYRFIEGYFKESPDNDISFEMMPYTLTSNVDASGTFTDKNGFYFAYSKAAAATTANIILNGTMNCVQNTITIPTGIPSGSAYSKNPVTYYSNHNNGQVGECNRVYVLGKITSLDGSVGYSNIAISIVGGETVYSKSDGTFTLIIHNGIATPRVNNIYINAGGDFSINLANCGNLGLYNYNESLAPCNPDDLCGLRRQYPFFLSLQVQAQGTSFTSLKQNSSYSVGIACADLAGRLQFVNPFKNLLANSFNSRGNVLPTSFNAVINGQLSLPDELKWAAFYAANNSGVLKYTQWVGDSIKYIDNNGNVVNDPASAIMCSIAIDSLYNNNVAKNLQLLANYQFSQGDRLRVIDDGEGNLLANNPIDILILGTTYNQAAINANLISGNGTNNVTNINVNNQVTTTTTAGSTVQSAATSYATNQNNTSITLYVKYTQQLDQLLSNNGFWIEIYTPFQKAQSIPYNELKWYPVVNGELADFVGFSNGKPNYNYLTSVDLDYWDTYFIKRIIAIPNIGDRYFNHPFESPNITDTWGANITSGGRQWIKNDDAKQTIFPDDFIRSDNFINDGVLNGLGTFRTVLNGKSNRKDFSNYPFGGIVAVHTEMSIIFVLCENSWFTVDYNYHFTYANEQGVMVTNLDNGISEPHQKIGDNFGCSYNDTQSIGFYDKLIWWFDLKNQAFVISDYRSVTDVTKSGMDSYFNSKGKFVSNWNASNPTQSKFDITSGIDIERGNLYLTFRPRRINSSNPTSFINNRRNYQVNYQETFVYNIGYKKWTRLVGFTPESYGSLRGINNGVELFTFASGIPYYHNNVPNNSYCNFYGVQVSPVIGVVFNDKGDLVKTLQSVAEDSNNTALWIDMIYSNQFNLFSYIPVNYFKEKETLFFSEVLRNMNSYPNPNDSDNQYRSMLIDGGRVFGLWFFARFILDLRQIGNYTEVNKLFYKYAVVGNANK